MIQFYWLLMLESCATSERQIRGGERCRAERRDETRRASQREKSSERAEQRRKRAKSRRGAKALSSRGAETKTGRVPCRDEKEKTQAERQREALLYREHKSAWCAVDTRIKRNAHLASLTPLVEAPHARRCISSARIQRRLRGNPQTLGACECAT